MLKLTYSLGDLDFNFLFFLISILLLQSDKLGKVLLVSSFVGSAGLEGLLFKALLGLPLGQSELWWLLLFLGLFINSSFGLFWVFGIVFLVLGDELFGFTNELIVVVTPVSLSMTVLLGNRADTSLFGARDAIIAPRATVLVVITTRPATDGLAFLIELNFLAVITK